MSEPRNKTNSSLENGGIVASVQSSLFPEPILFHTIFSETELTAQGHPGQVSSQSSVVDAKNEENLGVDILL